MKTAKFIFFFVITLLCLSACEKEDNPKEPTKPEEVKSEISIDANIITNGLSFSNTAGEQSVSFTTNESWTLSVAATTSGETWCTASATSGAKGSANVKFTVKENTSYDDRSVSVTIKSGTASKTFKISQKCANALLLTTNKYELSQSGGTIDIEVKANIDYKMEISENAKTWITESSTKALTSYKHKLNVAASEEVDKREGEIYFKAGDKTDTVKVYQAGGAIIMLTQNEYTISSAGDTISVDIKSNIDFGVQMPNVDWIVDEATTKGLSSHALKYIIAPNEEYDSRSAEIIFYDKNSELKDTLKVVQAQKDAIVITEKNISVPQEGGIVEVKLSSNVEIDIQIPSEASWIRIQETKAMSQKTVNLVISENTSEEARSTIITINDRNKNISESIVINQNGRSIIAQLSEAGSLKRVLGNDYLNIVSLKIIGPINGDDIYVLRRMLGGKDFNISDWGKLAILDLSEAKIVNGGDWYKVDYYDKNKFYYTSNDKVGDYMFSQCTNLKSLLLPNNITAIGKYAVNSCNNLTSIYIGEEIVLIEEQAFTGCSSLISVYTPNLSAWCKIEFAYLGSNPLMEGDGVNLFINNKELKELTIPDDITEIKDYAFMGSKISSVNFGNKVTKIGSSSFRLCNSLTSIDIPDNVTTIDDYAFNGCKNIEHISIGKGITTIGRSSFSNCIALKSIDIPDNVTSIGSSAFECCTSMQTAIIGNGVTLIDFGTFGECTSLKTVRIGNGVTKISGNAFAFCNSLSSFTIGENITEIGSKVFIGCTALTKFYCYANTPPQLLTKDSYAPFNIIYENQTSLYVPERCGLKYKSSDWGKYFKNIKEMD